MARFSGAALLVIVALGVTPSSALRCWVCNSENDNRCGDPFQKYEENFYLDCSNILTKPPIGNDYSAHRMVCVKTTRRIDSYRTLVHRSCEWGHVSNLQQSACSARENNPFFQNSYAGGAYPQAQVGYPQSYPGAGGYAGSNYPPGGYNQGGYRGYQQGGYQQGGYQQGGYGQNYPRNDYGGSYGQQGSYGGGGYGGSGGYVSSGYSGSYGSGYGHDYCVVCSTDGCNSAPHGVVVTPLTALAALLAPIATWLFARR